MRLRKFLTGTMAFIMAFAAISSPLAENIASLLPANNVFTASAYTYEDFQYCLLDDETLEITSYSGGATSVSIPSEINERTVTSIGTEAFWFCTAVTSITIPDSVTNIGDSAFSECRSLT